MKKKIARFDFSRLHTLIVGYVRHQLGWRRGLSVSFPTRNTIVRIFRENSLSAMWESMPCFVLLHCPPCWPLCCAMRAYRDCGGHRRTGVTSAFEIQHDTPS